MLGTYAHSAGSYDAFFKKAAQVRTLIIDDFNKVFENYDLIIGPTAPTPAYKIGAEVDDPTTMYMNDVLTIPVNLAGLADHVLSVFYHSGVLSRRGARCLISCLFIFFTGHVIGCQRHGGIIESPTSRQTDSE